MRRVSNAMVLLSLLWACSACTEWDAVANDEIAVDVDSAAEEATILTTIKPVVKFWEDHNGSALWPQGMTGAMIVLYPAQRGWGAYLFAKKPGQKPKLVADIQGKSHNFSKFIEFNMQEWNEVELPGSNLDHGVLGSFKKKGPGPGGPPGTDPKGKQIAAAQGLAENALGDLALKAFDLKVEMPGN